MNDNIRVVTSVIVPKYILPWWPGEINMIPNSSFSFSTFVPQTFILPPILDGYLSVEFTREDVNQLRALEQFFYLLLPMQVFVFCFHIVASICICILILYRLICVFMF